MVTKGELRTKLIRVSGTDWLMSLSIVFGGGLLTPFVWEGYVYPNVRHGRTVFVLFSYLYFFGGGREKKGR